MAILSRQKWSLDAQLLQDFHGTAGEDDGAAAVEICRSCSNTIEATPKRARSIAVASPIGPAPTITTGAPARP